MPEQLFRTRITLHDAHGNVLGETIVSQPVHWYGQPDAKLVRWQDRMFLALGGSTNCYEVETVIYLDSDLELTPPKVYAAPGWGKVLGLPERGND